MIGLGPERRDARLLRVRRQGRVDGAAPRRAASRQWSLARPSPPAAFCCGADSMHAAGGPRGWRRCCRTGGGVRPGPPRRPCSNPDWSLAALAEAAGLAAGGLCLLFNDLTGATWRPPDWSRLRSRRDGRRPHARPDRAGQGRRRPPAPLPRPSHPADGPGRMVADRPGVPGGVRGPPRRPRAERAIALREPAARRGRQATAVAAAEDADRP